MLILSLISLRHSDRHRRELVKKCARQGSRLEDKLCLVRPLFCTPASEREEEVRVELHGYNNNSA
jgi:hypothetical protein